jgi:hypothetical protein
MNTIQREVQMFCRLLVENKSILEIGWLELLMAQTIVVGLGEFEPSGFDFNLGSG